MKWNIFIFLTVGLLPWERFEDVKLLYHNFCDGEWKDTNGLEFTPSSPTASLVQSYTDSSTCSFLTYYIWEEMCTWLAKKDTCSDYYCKYGDVKWIFPDTCDFDCTRSCGDDSSFRFQLGVDSVMSWNSALGSSTRIRKLRFFIAQNIVTAMETFFDEEIREKCQELCCGFCYRYRTLYCMQGSTMYE